ncbi:MAG: hypothetical protein HY722_06255 [Planctomycetes bacterium]|nr:hypothetical protein [Planctomycetota bacterium]
MFRPGEPGLPYTLIPGWRGVDHGVPVEVNEAGLRDEPWGAAPAEGLRVVALGDSQTFGVSVERDRAFSEVLERALSGTGRPARVYNLGVPGWNLADQAAFLRHHWDRLRPAAVVQLFIWNDLDDGLAAGDSGQLMASRRPLEPFRTGLDPWVLEGFARAVLEDPALPFTPEAAYRNAWRVPFHPVSWVRRRDTPSGAEMYDRYERDLRGLAAFVRDRGSNLVVLAQTFEPEGTLDRELASVFSSAGLRNVFLDRWTGDLDYFLRNWSNLPLNEHGGERYHALVASVAQRELASLGVGGVGSAPEAAAPPVLEDRVSPAEWATMVEATRAAEGRELEGLSDEVAWARPETLRQVVCMGGPEGSQVRILFRPGTSASYVRIVPREAPPTGATPILWVEAGGERGYVPTAWTAGAAWGRLALPMAAGTLVEVGVVLGTQTDGAFQPLWPPVAVALHPSPPPGTLAWSDEQPIVEPGGVEGVEGDRWMGRRMSVRLLPAAPEAVAGRVLRIEVESMAPAGSYPMRLEARRPGGGSLAVLSLAGGGVFPLDVPLEGLVSAAGPTVVEVESDRSFVPHEVDPSSPDTRELSVRVLRLGVVGGEPAVAPRVGPLPDRPPEPVRVEGLTGDLWMTREADLLVTPREGTRDLVLEFESHAPPAACPIVVTLQSAAGRLLTTHTITQTGRFTLTVPIASALDGGARPRILTDRVFIPSALVPGNPDGRELSVRVLGGYLR